MEATKPLHAVHSTNSIFQKHHTGAAQIWSVQPVWDMKLLDYFFYKNDIWVMALSSISQARLFLLLYTTLESSDLVIIHKTMLLCLSSFNKSCKLPSTTIKCSMMLPNINFKKSSRFGQLFFCSLTLLSWQNKTEIHPDYKQRELALLNC